MVNMKPLVTNQFPLAVFYGSKYLTGIWLGEINKPIVALKINPYLKDITMKSITRLMLKLKIPAVID